MKCVVGLGNPGPKYETTRHNVGFLAVDRLIDCWGSRSIQKSFQAEIVTTEFGGEKVLLVKPQTYMNLSGRSVIGILGFYKLTPEDLIVIHDELDLAPFSLRIKQGGGTGGHNGLKSIDGALGAQGNHYWRIRLGVGHPRELGLPMSPADYVLGPYSDQELSQLDLCLDQCAEVAEFLLRGQGKEAMNRFNQKSTKG